MKENKIKLLDEREHVLTVPSRYIGSISMTKRDEYIFDNGYIVKKNIEYVPAFITLFREVISNSIDENIRTDGKFANKIKVSIKDNYITIEDNGRGLPHEIEERTSLPQSVVAFTRLKAGTNFEEKTTSAGQNGEGISLVNIFSKQFNVDTSDGTKRTVLDCKDNLKEYKYDILETNRKRTKISYLIDFKRLNMTYIDDIHLNLIYKLMLDMSVCYPNIKFIFNQMILNVKSFNDYVNLYKHETVEIFTYKNVDIAMFPSFDYEQISWVNGIYTRRGGFHISIIENSFIKEYRSIIGKKYSDIKPADVRNKIMFMINVKNMMAPRFDSQTKEELINNSSDLTELFKDIDFSKIARKIKKNKIITDGILETFRIKEELKRRKELAKTDKKIKTINVPTLIEATDKKSKNLIYIAEGQSALANFIECRDTNQAAFPLRGKPMNVSEMDSLKIAKSKKISELLNVLGLKISSKSISNLRYNRIVIFTDADYDGDAIMCLLINLFRTFWPDIIKENRLYKSISPLISAINIDTKEKKYFFDVKTFKKENVNNQWRIKNYNKGLGSLNKDEYVFSLNNLVQIEYDEIADSMLEIAFGNDSTPRKEWIIKNEGI